MAELPIVLSKSGYVLQTPSALQTALITAVAATSPGYTADLPGSLIEDIASTDVYALLQLDSSIAELINSMTPYGANAYLLAQLGAMLGVTPQEGSLTSVYVQFSGDPGFLVAQGFTVSDGTYQYVVQDGGNVLSSGVTDLLYAVATVEGTWSVPSGTVTQLVTSVPSSVTLSVNNPGSGIPASLAQTETVYRSRVLLAERAACTGNLSLLRTTLQNIAGVQPRLVSVRKTSTSPSQWEVICGGGDPYAIAQAINQCLFDLNSITGSVMSVAGITNANPGVVTTTLNHGLATGAIAYINGATGLTALNGVALTVTVITQTTFSVGVDTSALGTYSGGGVVTPNTRNVIVSILDYPDTYSIPFVNPPQQVITMVVTWNTIATNYVSQAAVAQLASAAIADYVNSVVVGQPLNEFVLINTFQTAVASVLPQQLLTRLVFSVSVDGTGVSPVAGTGEISGDAESYFYTSSSQIAVVQG